jgi:hypothetical protein
VHALGGTRLSTSDPIDGKTWFELAADASVAIRHGPSSREFELRGPGRALPCRAGLEQVLLSEGSFESSPGAGVRPGAEMWVATPFVALRYGDASLTMRARAKDLSVRIVQGRAASEADGSSTTETLDAPGEKRWTRWLPASERARSCEAFAEAARKSAEELLASTSELGKLAAAQLEQRRRARAQCLIAETALERLPNTAEKARLTDQVERANRLWQTIPAMVR